MNRSLLQNFKVLVLIASSGLVVSCKTDVTIQAGPLPVEPFTPNITTPSLVLPESRTHYSNQSDLRIFGFCLSGYFVRLSGSEENEVLCEDSVFEFTVSRTIDGVYPFFIRQFISGRESSALTLTWIRQTSVAPPSLSFPLANPFYSSQNILTITGNCQTGATLSLEGDAGGSSLCADSSFSLSVPQFTDGSYEIAVVQTDQAGNRNQTSFTWVKQALAASPASPQLVADSSQLFTLSGGDRSYSVSFIENNSGASYSSSTNTYRAGTLAGVTDRLQIADSLGATIIVPIEVVPAAADHFVLPADSGNEQTQTVGEELEDPLRVQVVDRFGNGVANFPVLFNLGSGDAEILSERIQTTNALGFAQVSLRMGYRSKKNRLFVRSRDLPLPDLAGSGDSVISLTALSSLSNNNQQGLIFASGALPKDAVTLDLNADGVNDVILLNQGEPSIGIFIGREKGLFDPMTQLTAICPNPTSMVAADFNSSGLIDLLVTCGVSNEWRLYLGLGAGLFSAPLSRPIDVSEDLPIHVTNGDLNGDGHQDIVIVGASSGTVSIRYGDGSGEFAAPEFLNAGTSPSKAIVGQMLGDVRPDIAVLSSAENRVYVFRQSALEVFEAPVVIDTDVGPSDLVRADFNADGLIDLAVASNVDNNVSVYLNDGALDFDLGIQTVAGDGPISLISGDFNQDGDQDLAVANVNDSNLSLLYGRGDGTFDIQLPIATKASPLEVKAASLNGDALTDLLVLSSGEQVLEIVPFQANGQAGFLTDLGAAPVFSKSADLNEDGVKDLAIVYRGANRVAIFSGNNFGFFAQELLLTTAASPSSAEIVDLNRDGFLDLIVTQEGANSARVFMGRAGFDFETPADLGTGGQPARVISGDFNNDGHLDLITANSGANTVSFFPGTGSGTFGTRVDSATGSQPVDLSAADLNRDGRLDLVVANKSDGSLSVLIGNGNGSFQSPTAYTAESGTTGVVTGFFDFDDFIDVAVINELSSSVSVYLGNGDGSLRAPANYFAGATPISIKNVDYNGDGNEDLVVANESTRQLTILYGSSFGDFSVTQTRSINANPVHIEAIDLIGNGAVDFAIIDGIGERLEVFLGH